MTKLAKDWNVRFLDLSDWKTVGALTLVGTAFCVAVPLYIDSHNFPGMTTDQLRRALFMNIAVPVALAGPLLFLLLSKMRQLTLVTRELERLASTDSLTTVLNRGGFSMLVEAYLEKAAHRAELRLGSMLVVDADHFKSVNDEFGHDSGDDALKLIAGAISEAVRAGDLVGRMGGEEFGVFLPGADLHQSQTVAERIRKAVSSTPFLAKGKQHRLSVSIGGAYFTDQVTFERLYEIADRSLYAAKKAGRDRVALTSVKSTIPATLVA